MGLRVVGGTDVLGSSSTGAVLSGRTTATGIVMFGAVTLGASAGPIIRQGSGTPWRFRLLSATRCRCAVTGTSTYSLDPPVDLNNGTKYALTFVWDSTGGTNLLTVRLYSFDGSTATLLDTQTQVLSASEAINSTSGLLSIQPGSSTIDLYGWALFSDAKTEPQLKALIEAGDMGAAANMLSEFWYEDGGKTTGSYVDGDLSAATYLDITVGAGDPQWNANDWLAGVTPEESTLTSAVVPSAGTTVVITDDLATNDWAEPLNFTQAPTVSASGGAVTLTLNNATPTGGTLVRTYNTTRTIDSGETLTFDEPDDNVVDDDGNNTPARSGAAITNNSTQTGGAGEAGLIGGKLLNGGLLLGGALVR